MEINHSERQSANKTSFIQVFESLRTISINIHIFVLNIIQPLRQQLPLYMVPTTFEKNYKYAT